MDLIIVESPHKAKTITKYLHGKYIVDASAGHIRDLPEKKFGISIRNDFEPTYEITPGKEDVIRRLKDEMKRADNVFLATDPDREGEAISWHLQTVLGLDPMASNRIEFNEISPNAVKNALKHPRTVNTALVNAQQARRVLDRIVGYKLSPLLCKRISDGLSAGRVQSVALRMIVDREREIAAFVPEEYWTIHANMQDTAQKFAPFRTTLAKRKGKKCKPANEAEANEVISAVKNNTATVTKVKRSVTKSHAPAPFTTSTLQQDGSARFGMTSPEIMTVAQHLYEGMDTAEGHIAFISYIRTDSVRISAEAQKSALGYIGQKYGPEYVPSKPNVYKTKKSAQDAHEAIRPIDVTRTPESVKDLLDRKHYNIYKLIYDRFIASQMAEARYDSLQIETTVADYTFTAGGKTMIFAGYTAAYEESVPTEKEDDENAKLPPVQEGDLLNVQDVTGDKKFTKPPLRYTDSSLVKTMEENGIGRPSTYASIISVLTKRKYVEKQGKSMIPTEVAYRITDMLCNYFTDIMDVNFTARMEDSLDGIEETGADWKQIIRDFYPPFAEKLKVAAKDGDEETDILCEKCGSKMIRRHNRYGSYLACSNYPECKNLIGEGEPEYSDKPCPACGGRMVIKIGKYGKFLSCENYPDCKEMSSLDNEPAKPCPVCGKPLQSKAGKFGKFFHCVPCDKNFRRDRAGNPVLSEETVTDIPCPACGKPLLLKDGRFGKYLHCEPCAKNIKCDIDEDGKPVIHEEKVSEVKCPDCGNFYLIKKGRYGEYYRCDTCKKNVALRSSAAKKEKVPDQPTDIPCPTCGKPYVLKSGRYGEYYRCNTCKKNVALRSAAKKEKAPDQATDIPCPTCGTPYVLKIGRYGEYYRCNTCKKNVKKTDVPPAPKEE